MDEAQKKILFEGKEKLPYIEVDISKVKKKDIEDLKEMIKELEGMYNCVVYSLNTIRSEMNNKNNI